MDIKASQRDKFKLQRSPGNPTKYTLYHNVLGALSRDVFDFITVPGAVVTFNNNQPAALNENKQNILLTVQFGGEATTYTLNTEYVDLTGKLMATTQGQTKIKEILLMPSGNKYLVVLNKNLPEAAKLLTQDDFNVESASGVGLVLPVFSGLPIDFQSNPTLEKRTFTYTVQHVNSGFSRQYTAISTIEKNL